MLLKVIEGVENYDGEKLHMAVVEDQISVGGEKMC